MKRNAFDYAVKAVISITGTELGRLVTLSRLHYDGKCRAARELGGVLYGLCNQWAIHNQRGLPHWESPASLDESKRGQRGELTEQELGLCVEVTLTAYELGLLAKISELESMYCSGVSQPQSGPGVIRSMMLNMQFTGIFAECSVEYDRINSLSLVATEG